MKTQHRAAEGRGALSCGSSSGAEQHHNRPAALSPNRARSAATRAVLPAPGWAPGREAVRGCPRTAVPLRQRASHKGLPWACQDSFANVFTWGRYVFTFTDVRASLRYTTAPRRGPSPQESEQNRDVRNPPRGRPPPGARRPAPLPSERPSAPHLPSRSAANGRAGVGLTRCAAASSGGGRALPEPRRFGGSFEASGAEAARHPATASRPRPRLAQREVCAWLQLRPPGLHGASCAEHSARLRLATHEAAPERFAAAAVGERRACPASRGRAASSFPRFLLFEDRGGPGPPRQRELCGAAVLENLPPRSLLTPQTPQLRADEGPLQPRHGHHPMGLSEGFQPTGWGLCAQTWMQAATFLRCRRAGGFPETKT